MKKYIAMILVILLCFSFCGFTYETIDETNERITELQEIKENARNMAEAARKLGYSEDSTVIMEAKSFWHNSDDEIDYLQKEIEQMKTYTQEDIDIIATVVYNEAWSGTTDRHKELVAAVVVNRVNSELFPNTVYDVVCQKGQYHPAYADPNSRYSKKARENIDNWAVCQEIAERALSGQVECPENVLYQSNYSSLGNGYYEVCYTSYSTTYFAYG